MTHKLVFSEESLSQLKKLDNKTAKKILNKLESASKSPHRFFERLAGRKDYKLRIGDYRIISRILSKEKTVFVVSLGHRKNIYRKLKN